MVIQYIVWAQYYGLAINTQDSNSDNDTESTAETFHCEREARQEMNC